MYLRESQEGYDESSAKLIFTGQKIRGLLNQHFDFNSLLPESENDKFYLNSFDNNINEIKSRIDVNKVKIIFSFKKNTLKIKWNKLDILVVCLIYYYINIKKENVLSYPSPIFIQFNKKKYKPNSDPKEYFLEIFNNKKIKWVKLGYATKDDVGFLSLHHLFTSSKFNDAMTIDQTINMNKYLVTEHFDEL